MQPTLASLAIASRDDAPFDGSAALRQPANRADPHMPPAMTQPGSRLGGSNLVASQLQCALEELHQLLAVGGTPAGNGIISGAGLNPPTAAVALLPCVISVQATAPSGFPSVLGVG